MSGNSHSPIDYIEPWRAELLKLAAYHMGPRLKQKLGPEDVVQDAIIHALKAWSSFRGNPEHRLEVGAWLRRILVNEVLENYRKYSTRGRNYRRELALMSDAEKSCASASFTTSTRLVAPPENALRNERYERLRQALDRLPKDQAHAVSARYIDRMKIREIAELLHMTDKMVSDRVGRGLATLTKILGES